MLPVLLALVLTTVIELGREAGVKSAGLRTHTLVGVGAAVFMLVSEYGFGDLLGTEHVALDPSRIGAQIVSGIGFIGRWADRRPAGRRPRPDDGATVRLNEDTFDEEE